VVAYFDTSALVPLLIDEPSSASCRRAWNDESVVTSSSLAYVEVHAALAQATRMDRLSTDEHRRAVQAFEVLWGDVAQIAPGAAVLRSAAVVTASHALRGYDAVHCASALAAASDDFVAVAGDHALLRAWSDLGIPVVDTRR